MMEYKKWDNILKTLHIYRSFDVARYLLMENDKIHLFKNFNQVQTGGKRIHYKYENHDVIFYGHQDNDRYVLSLHHYNNAEKEQCLVILIADGIGYIDNISYHKNCIDGLNDKDGGTKLLKIAIDFLKKEKKKYGIDKIQLKDNAFKYCSENKTKIRLSLLTTLTTGDTWFGRHGFIPYNSVKNIKDEQGCEFYLDNKKRVSVVKVRDTNIEHYIRKALKKLDMEDLIEDLDGLFKHYEFMPISTFLYQFLINFDEICVVFSEIYMKLSRDLGIFDFHGSSFYLPL